MRSANPGQQAPPGAAGRPRSAYRIRRSPALRAEVDQLRAAQRDAETTGRSDRPDSFPPSAAAMGRRRHDGGTRSDDVYGKMAAETQMLNCCFDKRVWAGLGVLAAVLLLADPRLGWDSAAGPWPGLACRCPCCS